MTSGFILRELNNYGITTEMNIVEHMASESFAILENSNAAKF